ncbi:hypothetical protein [Sphingomonas sp. KR3-1]|uniref:hypothetical protein n=1 Tax=Sphingomonas sp. KR3-1 TaxID=3156611 RepID=UPI0032B3C904
MSIDKSRWMSLAYGSNMAIADIPMCQFPLPGSHDAGSYGGINVKSKTQHYSIAEQLAIGVRYFDFRVRVDNGVFFSHHGSDESRDNPYTAMTKDPNTTYLFDEIVTFLRANQEEVVLICFQDFTSVWNQSFTEQDAADFLSCLKRDFGGVPANDDLLYIPGGMPTYGKCIETNQRALAIINDKAFPGTNDGWYFDWSQYLRDRFSDYKYWLHSWSTLIDDTLADQQNYLVDTGSDGRDLDLFWVSQAILGYSNVTTPNGESQNKDGASHLNSVFTAAYKDWWKGQSAIQGVTQAVQKPNVLLLDYSGVYDDFATDCYNLLTGSA